MTVAISRTAAKTTTTVGPTLIPGVSSSKNRMSPAPPDGIGPSPLLLLRLRFLRFLGMYVRLPDRPAIWTFLTFLTGAAVTIVKLFCILLQGQMHGD